MRDAPAFTVLAPVHRPPDLLPFALRSVQQQTRQDFELFVICDGAPEATTEAARAFAAADGRIQVHVHPKGERHGEAWRHLALQGARGRVVCQIGDDDLWFPDHLAEAEALMERADFGATLPLYIDHQDLPHLNFFDVGEPEVRRQMTQTSNNAFGPTPSAYRLETYRALPQGWSPAPPDCFTDLFMWRKFLALPGLRAASAMVATTLTFPAALRPSWSMARRREEIARYAERIRDPQARTLLWREALAESAGRYARSQLDLARVRALGRELLADVQALETAMGRICAAAGDPDAQAGLAEAALRALPDRDWRQPDTRRSKPQAP